MIKKYGPYAILGQVDGHGETKVVNAAHGCSVRLLELLCGYTLQVRNPDSWERWYAERRGIKNGDVVKIFNERGDVLCGAYVTERIIPGAVYVDHGSRLDPIVPGELDRGGAINTITPHSVTSRHAAGMVKSGFLVEVERANLDELRKKYHEAFSRLYDRALGLRMERVLVGRK